MTTIALLTDFGSHDPYVAAMKGVIVSRCDARLIDLTHEIAPHDIFGAAWFLRSILPWFGGSRRTVFVCVVDPGVGTDRRILAIPWKGNLILAPDNGLVSLAVDGLDGVHSVESESLFLPGGSATFHGRDRFAPVAAAVANGAVVADLGPEVNGAEIERLPYSPPELEGEVWRGTVMAIDRFGNVITDLEVSRLGDPGTFEVVIGSRRIAAFARTYAEGSDEPFLIEGSGGTLEVSIRNGRAADILHSARFDRVEVRRLDASPSIPLAE